jgi:hypothetical protein
MEERKEGANDTKGASDRRGNTIKIVVGIAQGKTMIGKAEEQKRL